MNTKLRGASRRLVAGGASAALAVAGLSLGLAAPAHAADEVRGTVTDAAGNGVSGTLTVYQYYPGVDDYYTSQYTSVETGRLALSLAPGQYKFRFQPDDELLQDEFYLDKTSLATADAVTVAPTAVLNNWVIDAAPAASGRVIDPAGHALSGVWVESFEADGTTGYGSDYTDEDGSFTVPVNPAGSKIRIGSKTDGSKVYVGEWFNDKPDAASADLVLPGGNLGDVTLTRGGAVTGAVVSDAGVPLRAIQVCADGGICDTTNAAGAYTILGVPAGQVRVSFVDRSEEYLSEWHDNLPINLRGPDGNRLENPDGSLVEPVPVTVGKDALVPLGVANLAPNPVAPAGVEFAGKVVDDSGAALPGIRVDAVSVRPDVDDSESIDSTFTRQDGSYFLTKTDGVPGHPTVKLYAGLGERDGVDRNNDTYDYGLVSTFSGNAKSYAKAPAHSVVPGGSVAQNFTLERLGGISGSITSAVNLPMQSKSVSLVRVDSVSQWTGGQAVVELDGTFASRNIRPGRYQVRFAGADHVSEWWNDATLQEKGKTITVRAGQTVANLNAALSNAVKAVERPELSGYPWVGKRLTVDTGTWNARGSFTAIWMVGKTPVATGLSYTPTKGDIGDKIVVQVTNELGEVSGMATTKASSKVGLQPKIKAKGKGAKLAIKVKVKKLKAKKVKGNLVAKEIVKVKKNGDVKYKKVGKVKVKKGKATLRLKLKGKGKHKVVLFFQGKGKVGSAEKTVKVKTKGKKR